MKAKTIQSILRKKFNQWVATIEDEPLRNRVKEGSFITGGAIASMLLGDEVNDFDVYFRSKETVVAVAEYYVARFKPQLKSGIPCEIYVRQDEEGRVTIVVKSAGIASEAGTDKPYQYFEGRPAEEGGGYVSEVMQDSGGIEDLYEETEKAALQTEDDGKPKYRPVFLSTNAITLSHRLQLVLRFYGEPEEVHKNYDFVHCTNYWTSWDDKLTLRAEAMESLLTRELRYVGSKYPVCSIIRLRKFLGRRWTINAGQILKMLLQVGELKLTDPNVLRDQLTGVDSAYFCDLLAKAHDKDPDKIDTAYLVEIIDRMF